MSTDAKSAWQIEANREYEMNFLSENFETIPINRYDFASLVILHLRAEIGELHFIFSDLLYED